MLPSQAKPNVRITSLAIIALLTSFQTYGARLNLSYTDSAKLNLSAHLIKYVINTWGSCLPTVVGGTVTNNGRSVTVVTDAKRTAIAPYPVTIHSITTDDTFPDKSRYKETKIEIYHNTGVTTLTPESNPSLPITLNGVSRVVTTNTFDASNTYGLFRRNSDLMVSTTSNTGGLCSNKPELWQSYFMVGFYPETYVGFFPSNTSVTAVGGKWSATVRLEASVGYNGKLTFSSMKNAENVMINGMYISNGLQANAPSIFYAQQSDYEIGVTDLVFSGHVSEPGSHEIAINVQYTLP